MLSAGGKNKALCGSIKAQACIITAIGIADYEYSEILAAIVNFFSRKIASSEKLVNSD
jgi:hypothetical protein